MSYYLHPLSLSTIRCFPLTFLLCCLGVHSAESTTDNYTTGNTSIAPIPVVPERLGYTSRDQHVTKETPHRLTSDTRSLRPTTEEAMSWTNSSLGYLSNIARQANVTNSGRLPVIPTTEKPKAYTRRDIYIRGHLLHHPPPASRNFQPKPDSSGDVFSDPNSSADSREDPDGANSRRKRKHSSTKARYYNYKMLYDTIKVSTTLSVEKRQLVCSI